MTDLFAHQVATRAIGGVVFVATFRDPADGCARFAVAYENRGGAQRWVSRHRFQDASQADAGAITLADFLGCEVAS